LTPLICSMKKYSSTNVLVFLWNKMSQTYPSQLIIFSLNFKISSLIKFHLIHTMYRSFIFFEFPSKIFLGLIVIQQTCGEVKYKHLLYYFIRGYFVNNNCFALVCPFSIAVIKKFFWISLNWFSFSNELSGCNIVYFSFNSLIK